MKEQKINIEQRNIVSNERKYSKTFSFILINNSPRSLIYCGNFRIYQQLPDAMDSLRS